MGAATAASAIGPSMIYDPYRCYCLSWIVLILFGILSTRSFRYRSTDRRVGDRKVENPSAESSMLRLVEVK